MPKLFNYVVKNFSATFFSIFIPLFGIASLIFFIQIASKASVIRVSFRDITELYFIMTPEILFFILPVSFFVASIVTLSKFSQDSEMIVIFSLGIAPAKIASIFLKLGLVMSVILLLVSLVMVPRQKQLIHAFYTYKTSNIDMSIKPSEFGQKIGDWVLFVEELNGTKLKNIAMYNSKSFNQHNLILASSAMLNKQNSVISFELQEGKGFNYDKSTLKRLEFESMKIYNRVNDSTRAYLDTLSYWLVDNKTRKFDLAISIIVSLLPLFSIPLMLYLGIINPRYQKRSSVFYAIVSLVVFYVLAYTLGKALLLHATWVVLLMWLLFGYLLYYKFIKKEY
jgi:lipopolysaccharide export system permease protein